MREMARKGIHSMTIQSYRGTDKDIRRPIDPPEEMDNLEWLRNRVNEIIWYGKKT